ncbi:DUF4387 domain-containing protein [Martelella soudanensis]|uniref:DUF4387 domain-containing protein n=1 Tax=unclassified Martelella TaxID=2629616 RepID=UPI0015DF3334|nr:MULTISPECIES: DUF4387 domain-containing protein [unclassified Martelella]
MTTLKDITKYVRSKNAGPFWVTVDMFFESEKEFNCYKDKPELSASFIAERLGVDPKMLKRFEIPRLNTIKFSFPRDHSQGGVLERDMHSGQTFVRLLDIVVAP